MNLVDENSLEVNPEDRRKFYQELYQKGGFTFWFGTYRDTYFNQEANDNAYAFWCEETRKRITDPKKRDLLAPLKQPHPFGTKRPCLEQNFYEILNQDNVELINVRESPILEITEKGVKTLNEGVREVDVLILATGFDSVTGGILDISITNGSGETIQQKWKEGTWTNLGLSTAGFPNMYFFYGPQAPTAFSNGPSTIEIQMDWITRLLVKMKENGYTKVEPTTEGELKWTNHVRDLWASSLFCKTDSWYQGANIPGKPREALNYIGGIPKYRETLEACSNANYEGFVLS